MPKYRKLIAKIQAWKKVIYLTPNSVVSFNQSELELIQEALETIQFLEIFFKERRIAENEKP